MIFSIMISLKTNDSGSSSDSGEAIIGVDTSDEWRQPTVPAISPIHMKIVSDAHTQDAPAASSKDFYAQRRHIFVLR